MDVQKILQELIAEREHLDAAILTIERIAAGRGRKRGRPPKWMTDVAAQPVKRRGRPPGSKNKPKSSGE
jgi:hypothetical protein